MNWDQLTSPEIAELDRRIPVLFPVSATEQHGPHLPLATDRIIGNHFCNELDKSIPNKILVLPIMSIGCSDHHLDFAGSLSIQHQTFLCQAEDILNSVIRHGFKNIVVFNSHGGNLAVAQVLIERFGASNPGAQIVLATWWKLVSDSLFELNETGPGGVGHAGEFETSLMLYINPDSVKQEKVEEISNNSTFEWAEGDMLRGSKASFYRNMKTMTGNGVFGDPGKSSVEKGEKITELVVDAMKSVVNDLYASK